MKKLLVTSFALSVMMLPNGAGAGVCRGDPVAISYKQLVGGNQRGIFNLRLPNGCQITCKAGNTKLNLNRVCHWR